MGVVISCSFFFLKKEKNTDFIGIPYWCREKAPSIEGYQRVFRTNKKIFLNKIKYILMYIHTDFMNLQLHCSDHNLIMRTFKEKQDVGGIIISMQLLFH